MRLIIEVWNLRRGTRTGKGVDVAVSKIRGAFMKKLTGRANLYPELEWEIQDCPKGFEVHITGPAAAVQAEHEDILAEFEKQGTRKAFQWGQQVMTSIGLVFNFRLVEE